MGKKRIIAKRAGEKAAIRKEIKIKIPRKIEEGKVYIFSSYNNTIITLTDLEGNVLTWTSAGNVGFEGTRKGTPYAASKTAEVMARAIENFGIKKIHVFVKGIGVGRESAIRTLAAHNVEVISIKDITPIPHNGSRPPKVRRV